MMLEPEHWTKLIDEGYVVVKPDDACESMLKTAVGAASRLHPKPSAEQLQATKPGARWCECPACTDAALMAIARNCFDPLANYLLVDGAGALDHVQLATVRPGHGCQTKGRRGHIDGGADPCLTVYNVLIGMALTKVDGENQGGFRLIPRSHKRILAGFKGVAGENGFQDVKRKLMNQLRDELKPVE